jgi:hypothetical protein
MGAAMLGQAASDAVIVTVRRLLTWANAVTWPVWPVAHLVRIEVIKDSIAQVVHLVGEHPCLVR